MLPNPLRRAATLVGALSLLALAGPASASALPLESQITAPVGPAYVLNDESAPSTLKVEGTTNIPGEVSLRCYFGAGATSESYATLAEKVTVSAEKFTAEVATKLLHVGPCVLRAVPLGDTAAHPPGSAAGEAGDPFKGPRVVGSRYQLLEYEGSPYDYQMQASTLTGSFDIESAGACGLAESNLYTPETLARSNGLFFCNAALYAENEVASGPSTRSDLQIDGANAYSPAAALEVESDIDLEESGKIEPVRLPGTPQVTVTKSYEAGLATINEVDPIVKCSPSTAFPPTARSCKSFVSTGVELEREWRATSGEELASMIDNWRSTDGAAHSLNALYDQELVSEGGAFELPGSGTFGSLGKGETVTLPAGPGTLYYKEDKATPATGDDVHPVGAIVYDTPPSGALAVYAGTHEKESRTGFAMPYAATIPAGGAYTLRMAFVQAFALGEVEALAGAVLAGYPPSAPPELSIAAPANGSTVSTPNVTVAGTVGDKRAITSFTVAGKPVSVGAKGEWSTSVALGKGANTITASATDQAGFTTAKSVTVTYSPPAPPRPHVSQVGTAKGSNSEVTFTILCAGERGTYCEVESTLTTIEKTRRGKLVAVSARRHRHPAHPATHSERVTVGSSKLTIPANQRVTITIQLNAIGKSLLARFGRLPVHLSVVEISDGHRATVIAENLTVTPAGGHHHHHHRRHHHRRHHHHHHHHR